MYDVRSRDRRQQGRRRLPYSASASALVRRGRGVMSATMATVMVRYAQMASSVIRMAQISSGRLPVLFAIAMSGRCCHDR